MLVLGEVQTAALAHSTDMVVEQAERLLALTPGERVLVSEHPIAHVVSPDIIAGIDCRLPMSSGREVRAVGTLSGRVSLTGGRVLQGSAMARIEPGANGYRRAWSHYLSRLGVVESIGRADPIGIAEKHLSADRSSSSMGMGGFCARLLATVQRSPLLVRPAPFRAGRSTLRWVATSFGDRPPGTIRFTMERGGVRTFWLTTRPDPAPTLATDVAALCADIARHDWLLTTLISIVERGKIGSADPVDVVARLRPAVDHLLHLWMPRGGRAETELRVWEALERRTGLSRQWEAQVGRIRDQIAMGAVLLHLKEARDAELFPGPHGR